MLQDRYNRIHDYARISLTDHCNFRCTYCMPEEEVRFLKTKDLMSAQEIFKLAQLLVALGVKKIRLTGGEPLLRNDFRQIISDLSLLPVKIGLTTNGFHLDRYLHDIKKMTISSINISLDTLHKENFKAITQRNHFEKVWKNICQSIAEGIFIKLNMVLMKGVNDHEILDFVQLTQALPLHVRFIEFMPFPKNHWDKEKVMSNELALKKIEQHYSLFKLKDGEHDTDRKFGIFGHAGTISFISTLSDSFCGTCNRIRITADGKMKNCLFSKEEIDLITPLRKGENLIPIIEKCIFEKHKKLGGQFDDYTLLQPDDLKNRSMINIGG